MGFEPTFGGFADLAVANSGALPLIVLCNTILKTCQLAVRQGLEPQLQESESCFLPIRRTDKM